MFPQNLVIVFAQNLITQRSVLNMQDTVCAIHTTATQLFPK